MKKAAESHVHVNHILASYCSYIAIYVANYAYNLKCFLHTRMAT